MVKRKPKKVVLTPSPVRRVCRATCSSTMKGHGGLAHGCTYTYCTANSHAAAPPPLHSVVAAQRWLVKGRKPGQGRRGYFGAAAPTAVTKDVTGSDLSSEEVVFGGLVDCCGGDEEDTAEGSGSGGAAPVGCSCRSSAVILVGSVELSKRRGCKAAVPADHGETLSVAGHEETLTVADREGGDLSGAEELLDAKHEGQSIPDEGGVVGGDAFTKPKPPNFLGAETGPEAPKKVPFISRLRWGWNGPFLRFFLEEEAAPSSVEES